MMNKIEGFVTAWKPLTIELKTKSAKITCSRAFVTILEYAKDFKIREVGNLELVVRNIVEGVRVLNMAVERYEREFQEDKEMVKKDIKDFISYVDTDLIFQKRRRQKVYGIFDDEEKGYLWSVFTTREAADEYREKEFGDDKYYYTKKINIYTSHEDWLKNWTGD